MHDNQFFVHTALYDLTIFLSSLDAIKRLNFIISPSALRFSEDLWTVIKYKYLFISGREETIWRLCEVFCHSLVIHCHYSNKPFLCLKFFFSFVVRRSFTTFVCGSVSDPVDERWFGFRGLKMPIRILWRFYERSSSMNWPSVTYSITL